jgi:hypothetical protein
MTKTTHTHRGTCQACGHVQAVDNVSGLVAKHGYTVTWGYFNGTCQGSGKRPAEHDVSHTRVVIKFCTDTAALHDAAVACLKDGSSVPNTFNRYNPAKIVKTRSARGQVYTTTGGDDVLPIAQATPAERAKAIALAIHDEEMHASGLRSHADMLTRFVLVRLGQPLYVAAELDAPKVKEAAPTVDVATATVVGTYKTKAARKEALDKLNRAYEKCRTTVQNAYLALPHAERTEAKTEVYYGPYQLNHWRAKHSAAVLNEFPSLASTVAEIEALVKAREAVKAAP